MWLADDRRCKEALCSVLQVTDRSVRAVAENCPELQFVGFMGCPVTSQGVIHLTAVSTTQISKIPSEKRPSVLSLFWKVLTEPGNLLSLCDECHMTLVPNWQGLRGALKLHEVSLLKRAEMDEERNKSVVRVGEVMLQDVCQEWAVISKTHERCMWGAHIWLSVHVCVHCCSPGSHCRSVEVNEPHSGGFRGEISSKGDLPGSSLTLCCNKHTSLGLLACPASFRWRFFLWPFPLLLISPSAAFVLLLQGGKMNPGPRCVFPLRLSFEVIPC